MADSYVCSGAKIRCTMGTGVASLTVLPTRTVLLTGKPQANVSDTKPIANIGSCGNCRSLAYEPTAAATAANEGVLTPMPCVPGTGTPWSPGKLDYLVQGPPALLKSDHCQCAYGGTISLINDGQTSTGPADLSRKSAEVFEKDQLSTEGLDPDAVLDGIQMALDVAGMVPLAGAVPDLINAAISACRGNWADAGLSLLAAVPGAGDVAGGAKIVKNGVKIAKNAQKEVKYSENVVSFTEKRAAKLEKQIAESDKVTKLPVDNKSISNSAVEKGTQSSNNVTRIDNYKIETKKQANGTDIRTVTRISDKEIITTKNSYSTGGTNSSPSGFDNSYNVNSIKSSSGTGSSTEKKGSSIWPPSKENKKPVRQNGEDNILKFPEKTPTKEGDAKKLDLNS